MILKINAEQRKTERKSDLTKLRGTGLIPAVIYGAGTQPMSVSLVKADFMKLYKKSFNELVFYEVTLDGKEYHTLLKERQIHPVSREILHIDFMVIPHDQMIDVEVPIKFVGTPVGTQEGGVMDIIHRTLHIQCMEKDIPDDIEADISALNIGEAYHVRQLPQGKWKVKDNLDNALVTIHTKKIEQPATPAAEAKPEEAPEAK